MSTPSLLTADDIIFHGLHVNGQKKLMFNLISSFELPVEEGKFVDKRENQEEEGGGTGVQKESSFHVNVHYKSGRGKLLFGLVTDLISSADGDPEAPPTSQTIHDCITQLIQDLTESDYLLSLLGQAMYKTQNNGSIPWTALPESFKGTYLHTLKNILLVDLNDMLRDVTNSFQSLTDFETLWESCWMTLFESHSSCEGTITKLIMTQYAYMLTSILNLIRGSEEKNPKDNHRYYSVINIAASIAYMERLYHRENFSTKCHHVNKRGLDSSSSNEPHPKRIATKDHSQTSALEEPIPIMIISTDGCHDPTVNNYNDSSDIESGSKITHPVRDPLTSQESQDRNSSTIQFIARLAGKLLTDTVSIAMEDKEVLKFETWSDEHLMALEKLIDTQTLRIERSVSTSTTSDATATNTTMNDHDHTTKMESAPPLFPSFLNLSILPLLWDSTATFNDASITSLQQIYYTLIDYRSQSRGNEFVKFVDDIMIRSRVQSPVISDVGSKERNNASSVIASTATNVAHNRNPTAPVSTSTSSSIVKRGKTMVTRKSTGNIEKLNETSIASAPSPPPPTKPITLSMELGEWASFIISSASSGRPIRPTARLDSFFQSLPATKDDSSSLNVMITALNDSLNRLIHFMKGSTDNQLFIESTGLMTSSVSKNHELTVDIFMRGIVFIFYYVLEAILVFEASRMKLPLFKLLESRPFYNGIFTFSCVCLYRATGGPLSLKSKSSLDNEESFVCDNLDTRSILELIQCSSCDYFRVSEAAVRSLVCFDRPLKKDSSSRVENTIKIMKIAADVNYSGLPTILLAYLRQEENFLLESHLWASRTIITESPENLWNIIDRVGILRLRILDGGLRNKTSDTSNCESIDLFPDYSFMSYIFRRVLVLTSKRIVEFLARLSVSPDCPIAARVWETFLHILRHEIHLLRDRHVDQIILCTVYGVCKVSKYTPSLTFVNILREYYVMRKRDIGESGCDKIVRDVRLSNHHSGDILEFYNSVFVSVMKECLMKSTLIVQTQVTDTSKEENLNVAFTVKSEKLTHKSPGGMVHCHAFGSVSHFHKKINK